jgi:N-acetyl-beta-hexosaminidase
MKRNRVGLTVNFISLFAVLALLLLLSNTAAAQRAPSGGSSPGRDRDRESGVREHNRQLQVLLNSTEPKASANSARLEAIIEQTRQDFGKIQDINRELVTTLKSRAEPDYKGLAETATELRKRARRLKENISLPPPAEERPREKREGELESGAIRDALSMLSARITSFTSNPLFQTQNLIDVQLGAQASRDLETIIELSTRLKKSAERLAKSKP